MKNLKKHGTLILVALLIAANCLVFAFGAGTAGTASDPVVTKSYVDSMFTKLENEIKAQESSSSAEQSTTSETTQSSSEASDGFIVEYVLAGQSLIGEGGTEIIMRTGAAKAIGANGVGVCDVTKGADLTDGAEIVKNHLMIVPRTDGRGIKCTKNCYVMVKGAYIIE